MRLRSTHGEQEFRIDDRPLGEPVGRVEGDGVIALDFAIEPEPGRDGPVRFSVHAVGAGPTRELLGVSLLRAAGLPH
ncbi:hypothetical protein Q0F99_16340 [Rathayibacter oskolensis]|uniref:hypothetical protein n=1 Tax=Rathayibacter oskolensis TaxID=1891671 RepID=UPI00265F2378|nr:hypothetical protein [Rathayibacter oskolensis]WKK71138.1 hypothetical protein Q0F99_16340 [Rathayibacter oskolensis]